MDKLHAQIDELQRNAERFCERLTGLAKDFDLPAAPDALAGCRQKMLDGNYQVLIAGEVKRGKSSFINSLIGEEILPTDVGVATSQVFRVKHSEVEGYRLRFVDGTAREIRREDLARYGSQFVEDLEGPPRLDQIILWIEVDYPTRFLPPEVAILDTPGLGGMYKHHAGITAQFIPDADAVVFVLDSTRPIVETELEYLESILIQTGNVFFIQTKIDLFRTSQWQAIKSRNEEILKERFGDRLQDTRVWPLSSKLLLRAVSEEDSDFEIASRLRETLPALDAFLFRASGWTRVAETLIVASDYHRSSQAWLDQRYTAIKDESQSALSTLQQDLAKCKHAFMSEWGERGEKRLALAESIRKTARIGKSHLQQFFAPNGKLVSSLHHAIDKTSSFDELRTLRDQLADIAAADATEVWRQVSEQSMQQCREQLAPFMRDADSINDPGSSQKLSVESDEQGPEIAQDWFRKLKWARMDFRTGAWMGGGGAGIAVALLGLATPVIGPLVGVAALVGGLWSVVRGAKAADQHQLEDAKRNVSRFATRICEGIRQQFLEVDIKKNTLSPVDNFFDQLQREAEQHVARIVSRKATEVEQEISRLKASAEKSKQERIKEAEKLKASLTNWEEMGRALRILENQLTSLDEKTRV